MEVFKIPVLAYTAAEAAEATREQHGRPKVSWVQDSIKDVLRSVEARRVRAQENPELYADKIAEYSRIERKIHDLVDLEETPAMALIEALALNGDGRLTDPERVCAVWVSGDQWIVFGGVT